jgi:hypothetical protein
MTFQSMPLVLSRMTQTIMGIVFAALLFSAGATAEEPSAAPAVKPLPDLSADLLTTMFDQRGHASVSQVHIYRSGSIVRYEHRLLDPPEISIMDYGKLKEYRIYAGDKIYFETPVADRLSHKAQRDGILRLEENPMIIQKRILLKEDSIEGHPCDVILLIRTIKNRKEFGAEYTLLWEARDLDRQPLRTAYYQTNDSLVVLNFKDVKLESVDPTLMEPPPGFAEMNPY